MKKGVWLIVFLFCFCFLTMATGILSTHRQVRQLFNVPRYMGVIPQNVRSVILDQLSLNSSLEQVNAFLAIRGLGRDGRSRCISEKAKSQIICSVGLQHWFWEGIRETYFVSFEFDAHQHLCDVFVHSKLTGPNTADLSFSNFTLI